MNCNPWIDERIDTLSENEKAILYIHAAMDELARSGLILSNPEVSVRFMGRAFYERMKERKYTPSDEKMADIMLFIFKRKVVPAVSAHKVIRLLEKIGIEGIKKVLQND